MPTRQEQAVRQLWRAQLRAGGVVGRYTRGVDDTGDIDAVQGRQDVAGGLLEDIPVLDTDTEWLFLCDDLVVGGSSITPTEGDVWRWEKGGGAVEVYRVLPPSQGERCWRYADQTQCIARVFMKHRETV